VIYVNIGARGNTVAIKFNHKKEILAIRDGFPKYYGAHTSTKIEWEDDFAENDFRGAYATGAGKDEKLVLSTKIIVDSKIIPVTFIENAEGALDIKVNRETVYTIKPRGRISQSLLFAFTRFIIKEQR
jgi:hypothetical protein